VEIVLMIRAIPTLLALFLLVCGASASLAGENSELFTEERFETLQGENALILVDVAASWCPTCAKQKQLIEDFRAAEPDVPLHVLRVDFDNQKQWVKHFKAPRQSTLILYKGTEKVWFAVAETRQHVLFKVIRDANAG
jgi:thioredoxin 1